MFLYVAVAIILLIFVVVIIEQKILIVSKYIVQSKKISEDFDNTSFVVLADLHNQSIGNNNKRLINKINLIAPDFILLAGDMITKENSCIPSVAYQLIEELSKSYTIYYAYGNHEQAVEGQSNSTWVEYKKNLINMGVIFLNNENIALTKKSGTIQIAGVSIDKEYFKRINMKQMESDYLYKLIKKETHNHFQILLAHNPMYFDAYANWGADLTLSGHLHGGLIRLPFIGGLISPQVNLFPKYDGGRYTKNDQDIIVSKGLGTHSLMIRLFNPPELVSVILKQERHGY